MIDNFLKIYEVIIASMLLLLQSHHQVMIIIQTTIFSFLVLLIQMLLWGLIFKLGSLYLRLKILSQLSQNILVNILNYLF